MNALVHSVQTHPADDVSMDSYIHDGSLRQVREDLESEGVDATVGGREDAQNRVVGVPVIEDNRVKLVGPCYGRGQGGY